MQPLFFLTICGILDIYQTDKDVNMKKAATLLLCLMFVFSLAGCSNNSAPSQIVATTLPVYTFAQFLCDGTGVSVEQLITEDISCLHDYSLKVPQMQAIESAEVLIISGVGMEGFLNDTGTGSATVIDASQGIALISPEDHHTEHDDSLHHHDADPHIWLSPNNAKQMAQNICVGLAAAYPQHESQLWDNLDALNAKLDNLQAYAEEQLGQLNCREIITFHDGFAYMADAFDLTILEAIQEESGSEVSAKEMVALIKTVQSHNLPAVFTEINGSSSVASVISAESGAKVFSLSMAMSGGNYFEAMYYNIDVLKEALG